MLSPSEARRRSAPGRRSGTRSRTRPHSSILEGATNGGPRCRLRHRADGTSPLQRSTSARRALPHQGVGFAVPAGLTVRLPPAFNNDGSGSTSCQRRRGDHSCLMTQRVVPDHCASQRPAAGPCKGSRTSTATLRDLVSIHPPAPTTRRGSLVNARRRPGTAWAPGPVTTDAVQARRRRKTVAITSIATQADFYLVKTSARSRRLRPASHSDVAQSITSAFEQTESAAERRESGDQEGSIALRAWHPSIRRLKTPLWYLTKSAQPSQFGSSDRPDGRSAAINDEPDATTPFLGRVNRRCGLPNHRSWRTRRRYGSALRDLKESLALVSRTSLHAF